MKNNYSIGNIMSMFGYVVAALFVVAGLFLIFFDKFVNQAAVGMESGTMRTVLGFVIALYGMFRAVIIYQKRKEASNDENEN